VDLHTSQNQRVQLEQQQQIQQIDQIKQAADLQTTQANTARDQAAQVKTAAQGLRDQADIDQAVADQQRQAAQAQADQAVLAQQAADLAANNNVIAQNNIQQNINQAVQVKTQQLQDQLAYAEVGDEISMATTKKFSGKELEEPEKHVKRFKLNVLSKNCQPM